MFEYVRSFMVVLILMYMIWTAEAIGSLLEEAMYQIMILQKRISLNVYRMKKRKL